jgi:hypoxia up-regulated 1
MSQMWNWSTRLFLTEAKQNLTREEAEGGPLKYTKAELETLEKQLIEHEKWLNIGVEKQKSVKFNEDPAIETAEMRKRAEELSLALQKLVRRKAPKVKKSKSTSSTATSTTGGSASAQETSSPTTSATAASSSPHDEL